MADLDHNSAHKPLTSHFYDHYYTVTKDQHTLKRVRQLFTQTLDYPLPIDNGDYDLNHATIVNIMAQPYLIFLHGTT